MWITADGPQAQVLQRPLADKTLMVPPDAADEP
jgi:hypothetical protein